MRLAQPPTPRLRTKKDPVNCNIHDTSRQPRFTCNNCYPIVFQINEIDRYFIIKNIYYKNYNISKRISSMINDQICVKIYISVYIFRDFYHVILSAMKSVISWKPPEKYAISVEHDGHVISIIIKIEIFNRYLE